MRAKILLGVVILNILCVIIYLAVKPSTVQAGNTKAVKQKQVEQQVQQPAMDSGDQVDMLRQREEQVKSREMELNELEKQVTEKIKKLETIEASLRTELEAYKVVAGERVKQLVKIYSSMKPKAAATLMNNLDLEVAVQVILGMKGDIAGGILSYMDPQKAAAISQRLMTFRTGVGAQSLTPAEPAADKQSSLEPAGTELPSNPAVSSPDEKPTVSEKAHRYTARGHALAKRTARLKQTLASIANPSPASAPVPAKEPVIVAAPALKPAAASTPAIASSPASASAPAVPSSAPAPASTPAPALAAGDKPAQ